MSVFDIDRATQNALDDAFVAGEHRGKQRVDAALMQECIALRVERDALRVRLARRDAWQATLMNFFAASTVIGSFAFVAWVVASVAS